MAWLSVMGLDRRIISIFSRHSRMLKKSASFVLGSSKSSTYPRGYASGFESPAALLDGHFEHPAGGFSIWAAQLKKL